MNSWKHSLREGMLPGLLAGLFSTAALVMQQRHRRGLAAHVAGDEAPRSAQRQAVKTRSTAKGLLMQQAATLAWGVIYQRFIAKGHREQPLSQHVRNAALASTAASLTNVICTPREHAGRLEHRLPTAALVAVYASLAVAMAAGSQWLIQRHDDRQIGR